MDKKKYTNMFLLVKKYHVSQTRNNGKIPYWFHCQNVAKIIECVLKQTREVNNSQQLDLIISGLGHDLYEDAPNSKKIVKSIFSKNVDRIISEITNECGDNEIKKYVDKLKTVSEEVALIKLADLYDNTMNAAYSIHENGLVQTKVWFDIMKPQWITFEKYSFSKFKYSGQLLNNLVNIGFGLLKQAITNYQSIKRK